MHTQATEAIRAYFTLQCCWLNNEEVYLEKGCLECGSAASYLIYYTNSAIQKMLLNFIGKYSCKMGRNNDLMDIPFFAADYEFFLQDLENQVNLYAREFQELPRQIAFEQIDSIFELSHALAC